MPICLHPAPLAVDERKGDQRLSLVCSPMSRTIEARTGSADKSQQLRLKCSSQAGTA
jgi:hypothetical protein